MYRHNRETSNSSTQTSTPIVMSSFQQTEANCSILISNKAYWTEHVKKCSAIKLSKVLPLFRLTRCVNMIQHLGFNVVWMEKRNKTFEWKEISIMKVNDKVVQKYSLKTINTGKTNKHNNKEKVIKAWKDKVVTIPVIAIHNFRTVAYLRCAIMGRKSVSKKAKKGKEKAQERKKKEIAKKAANDANVELSEEEEDDDDIVPILMKKCKMTEEEVIAAHQNFLEKCPGGEMSKEGFLLENEVKMQQGQVESLIFTFGVYEAELSSDTCF